MDITMPDGTVVTGIPDDISADQLQALQGQYQPKGVAENLIAEDKRPRRTLDEELGRQGGLTVRHALKGGLGALTGINDAVNMAFNGVMELAGIDYRQGMATDSLERGLDAMGLPKPETGTEKVVGTMSEFVAGAAPFIQGGNVAQNVGRQAQASVANDVASQVAGRVGATMADDAAMQGVSAITGGASAAAADAADLGPIGTMIATILGGAAPSVGKQSVHKAFAADDTGARVQALTDAGVEAPTVGQVGSRMAGRAEAGIEALPGGGGLRDTKHQQTGQLRDELAEVTGRYADDTSPQTAGAVIERGITDVDAVDPTQGGFVQRTGHKASQLYDDVEAAVGSDVPVELNNTMEFSTGTGGSLAESAPRTARRLSGDWVRKFGEDLAADLEALDGGGLTYGQVKELRTKVGQRLDGLTLVDDASKAELKRLYGALSDDLAGAATTPEARRAQVRADKYYKARMKRIEGLEEQIGKAGGPEKVYKALENSTKDGSTGIARIYKSLEPDQRKMLAATHIDRMGKATPGQQNFGEDVFSVRSFITNYNKIDPKARRYLFASDDMKAAVDRIGKAGDLIDENYRANANKSGTARTLTAAAALATTGIMGFVDGGLTLLGATAGANMGSRLMHNKNFINWLAKNSNVAPGQEGAAINTLAQMAAHYKDPDMAQLAEAMQQGGEQ